MGLIDHRVGFVGVWWEKGLRLGWKKKMGKEERPNRWDGRVQGSSLPSDREKGPFFLPFGSWQRRGSGGSDGSGSIPKTFPFVRVWIPDPSRLGFERYRWVNGFRKGRFEREKGIYEKGG